MLGVGGRIVLRSRCLNFSAGRRFCTATASKVDATTSNAETKTEETDDFPTEEEFNKSVDEIYFSLKEKYLPDANLPPIDPQTLPPKPKSKIVVSKDLVQDRSPHYMKPYHFLFFIGFFIIYLLPKNEDRSAIENIKTKLSTWYYSTFSTKE